MIPKSSLFYLSILCLVLNTSPNEDPSQDRKLLPKTTGPSQTAPNLPEPSQTLPSIPRPSQTSPTILGPGQTASNVIATTKQIAPLNNELTCNQEMMISYGLQGYGKPINQPHQFCPSVTENCCTFDDEKTTMYYWTTDSKHKIERYYEVYLYSLKIVLGFTSEGFLLARDFEKSPKIECKLAAVDYLAMNLNPKLTMDMYGAYVESLSRMGDLRRGFFCTLCDARTQSKLRDFWASTNLFYQDRIYFSKEFCRKLVDYTIKAAFFTVNYMKRYTENLATLMNCKSGAATKLVYDIPFWTRQQIKNCFFFKNKYFFYFCENYCEQFHLTKASALMDGDLLNLKKFVDHISKYRTTVFYYPSNNLLMDGLTYEESFLQDMFPEVLRDIVFFRAGSEQQVLLDKFKTDVVFYGGMDPFISSENSKYILELATAPVIKAFLASLLLSLIIIIA